MGRFVEVEIVASAEQRGRAEQVLQVVARELGLENPEPRYTLECYPVVLFLAARLFT